MRKYFKNLNKFGLRAFEEDDLDTYRDFLDNSDVTKFLEMGDKPTSKIILNNTLCEAKSKDNIVFSIVEKENDKLIGTTGLYLINWTARRAQFRILMGDPEYYGKGIGTKVTKSVVEYGFERLNLEMIYLGVNKENLAAIKVYKNSGFIEGGIMRKFIYNDGKYYDSIHMSIVKEEFNK